jgi:hypothetical protein
MRAILTSAFDERLSHVLKSGLTPALEARDFHKSGPTYRFEQGDLSWLVNVQKSRWNAADEVQFTINGGIYIPRIVSRYTGRAEPKQPSLVDCCISVRIGMLSETRIDEWWKLTKTNHDDDGKIAAAVVDRVEALLLPFLARFRSKAHAGAFLAAAPTPENKLVSPRGAAQRHVYAALIYDEDGQRAKARCEIGRAVEAARGTPNQSVVEAIYSGMSEQDSS